MPIAKSELDALSQSAGYANFGALSNELGKGTTINASKLGTYVVTFGSYEWWPVLAKSSGNDIILTLWLKTSVGDYSYSDGSSSSSSASVNPNNNNYTYSWIRAAINAGQTAEGYYYGKYSGTTQPTKYDNSVKSPSANCAPTAFTAFADFVSGGQYADYIVAGSDGDNVWLPLLDEAKSGGSWGCTATQCNGVVFWTRTPNPSYRNCTYTVDTSGESVSSGVHASHGVRPAINVKISNVTVSAPTADQTPKIYTGNTFSFPMTYDPSYVDITSVTGKDFNDKTISVSTADIVDGVLKASLAGTYTVTFNLNQTATDNGMQWSDEKGGTDKREITFTINRQAIAVPTIQNTPSTYKADEYEFGLSGYDSTLMSVASYIPNNGSTITWDTTNEKIKATDADTYTVKFHLDNANYIWTTDGGESASDQSKTITINKKEITINTTPATNLSWGLQDSATLTVNASASGIDDPDFELEIYYIKGTDTTNHITTGITGTTLDISQVATSGEYKLCVALKASYAGNKNYSIANNVKEIPFTIGSGAIDFSVIRWQYQSSGEATLNDLYDDGGNQAVIRYKQSTADGSAIKYTISAYIPEGNYLSIASGYSTGNYIDGLYTYSGSTIYKDGCSAVGKYYTRIVLNTDKNHVFDNDHKLNDDGTLGWYEIEWEISKGQIDSEYLNNLAKHLQYKVGATGSWQSYDPENPPEYSNGSSITVRIDSNSYRYTGLTGAEITFGADGKTIGTYSANVSFSYDSANYENPGVGTFTWEIAKQSIKVEWTTDDWTAENGDEFQIRVLDITETLMQYVEYEYYLANSDLTMDGTLIGVGDAGLQALIDNHGASLNSALSIYVKVVLKNPDGNYRLVDKTGNPYECALLYKLGSNNTIVYVRLSEKTAEYGSGTLNTGILSLIVSEDDSELDRDRFVERIYVVDSDNKEYDWDSFDFATASKGTYTIKIKLNEDGENDYVLSWSDGHTFEILPKAIAVPTLSDIVFKNDFVDLRDYLGGSWTEYQSIIKFGGTYDGVKNVGTYSVTLTLTDENYCWDYGTSASPVKATVKYSLTDGNVAWTGDETVASYDWKITPYVLKASSWNLSGKEGAVYNIP
ncbi:MAG: hypothetical protein K2J83_02535, partial [Clostridia bacterium]|nr:hypothetical protein [Clostridia bacterium]